LGLLWELPEIVGYKQGCRVMDDWKHYFEDHVSCVFYVHNVYTGVILSGTGARLTK
jgi:hypothetical protein